MHKEVFATVCMTRQGEYHECSRAAHHGAVTNEQGHERKIAVGHPGLIHSCQRRTTRAWLSLRATNHRIMDDASQTDDYENAFEVQQAKRPTDSHPQHVTLLSGCCAGCCLRTPCYDRDDNRVRVLVSWVMWS